MVISKACCKIATSTSSFNEADILKKLCHFLYLAAGYILPALSSLSHFGFFFSKYKLKGETLFCYTGFIKTKLSLVDLSQIQFEEQTERTFLVFNEDKALVIMLYSKDVTEFVNEVIKNNNKVEFRSLPKLK